MKKLNTFPYEHVLVLGLAKSGTAAATVLLEQGKKVRINDIQVIDQQLEDHFNALGAEVITGSHPLSVVDNIDIVVKNPGIPYDNPIIKEATKRHIPIITEIEIAAKLSDASIIGVTGSNGKTTTTMLITDMLTQSKKPVKVAGNIGTVATEIAKDMHEDETLVLELSSFQLLGVQTFKPHISILLNIYEAHLDYHKTIDHYVMAKCQIFRNQLSSDFLVYNADDKTTAHVVTEAKATLMPFSRHGTVKTGAWADATSLYFKGEKIIDKKDIALVGDHNVENILAAICAIKLSGGTSDSIRKVLMSFTGVKHRLQLVDRVNNRLFYNDSKATNMLATQKALLSFKQPTILLAGGLDRGNEFTDLLPYLTYIKAMVVFGETAFKLKELAKKADIPLVEHVKDVEEAVVAAYQLSDEGDVILLSPACASWDQYRTFEERGDMFIKAVHKLS
ncbi:MAG TPA: UDP-N-acetylmuramoyl-L-alanine--D-glutamate ligase [Virgibacillus sp.]|nr:UDP-N-acetylmuramoyl-L-alanine--D-glutamate ligase [Virgibacillus sp.]